MKFAIGVLAGVMAATIAHAADYPEIIPAHASAASDLVVEGVDAWRAHNYPKARDLLREPAIAGDQRAVRYLAYASLDDEAARPEILQEGVALLKKAALAGDYPALVRLEQLRRLGFAHSPSLADIVAIEEARADAGDPVSAWRLARRVDAGEALAGGDVSKWLAVAAAADVADFPKAGDAAFRLCEMRAGDASADNTAEARHWCEKAAGAGHAGATIMLRRLASLD